MLRIAPLVLALNILVPATVAAQEHGDAYAEAASDSAAAARAGQLAAGDRGVGGYFVASFLGGLPVGFLLPIGVTFTEPFSIVVGGTGAAVIGFTTHQAARRDLPTDSIIRAHIRTPRRDQVRVFRAAYRDRLSRRRVRASLWGGAIGVGVGAGTLMWLISQMEY